MKLLQGPKVLLLFLYEIWMIGIEYFTELMFTTTRLFATFGSRHEKRWLPLPGCGFILLYFVILSGLSLCLNTGNAWLSSLRDEEKNMEKLVKEQHLKIHQINPCQVYAFYISKRSVFEVHKERVEGC